MSIHVFNAKRANCTFCSFLSRLQTRHGSCRLLCTISSLSGKTEEPSQASVTALTNNCLSGDLTCRALQSHLQTRQCSVVLGDSTTQVESALGALTALMDHEELSVSLWEGSPRDGLAPCYAPGLQLQGLVRGPCLSAPGPLSARELVWSANPSTVVDVSQGRVLQCPLHLGFKGTLTRKYARLYTQSTAFCFSTSVLCSRNYRSSPIGSDNAQERYHSAIACF